METPDVNYFVLGGPKLQKTLTLQTPPHQYRVCFSFKVQFNLAVPKKPAKCSGGLARNS